ncbi:MAG: D-glycerate dehydrogenase [Proteobacteria bacterium]|nr:D-glycerate dehydrogenase [Pseudomonadota bacterium]
MNREKPLVILTRRLPEGIETRMNELFNLERNLSDEPLSREAMVSAVQRARILVSTITDKIDAELIAQAGPNLKLIAQFGNGTDNIDVSAAMKRGITVTNTPGVLTEDMADFTMALIVAVARRFVEGVRVIPEGKWTGWSPSWMLGHRIHGKRLGIIGMGRIGLAVARRARAFGLQVHYHNRRPAPKRIEEEVQATYWDSLDRMLTRMDILSIHCPHTPATFHLMSERRLKLLKPEAILINTARGEIVDTGALAGMLEADQLAGAALDVYEHNVAEIEERLIRLANHGKLALMPHMGSSTVESRNEMGEKVIINIKTFIDGHTPPDRVIALPGL